MLTEVEVKTVVETVVETVDATVLDGLVVVIPARGSATVVDTTPVGTATLVGTATVVVTASLVDSTSVDCGAVSTVPQPPATTSNNTAGNQRLSTRLRRASARLIPLEAMSRRW